jgi:hypothetical protein
MCFVIHAKCMCTCLQEKHGIELARAGAVSALHAVQSNSLIARHRTGYALRKLCAGLAKSAAAMDGLEPSVR